MICKQSCGIALVFLIANIYLTLNSDKYTITKNYEASLSPAQLQRYKNIVNERKTISLKGYGLGFAFSLVLILMKKKNLNKKGMACLAGAITFITQYLFYILSPKSDWMVLHLDTKTQRQEWLKVYRTMQFNYHMGLGLGVAAVMALSYALC